MEHLVDHQVIHQESFTWGIHHKKPKHASYEKYSFHTMCKTFFELEKPLFDSKVMFYLVFGLNPNKPNRPLVCIKNSLDISLRGILSFVLHKMHLV